MCTYHNIRSFQDAMAMAMLLSNTNAGKYNNMKINLVSKAGIEVRYITIIVCPAVLVVTGKYTIVFKLRLMWYCIIIVFIYNVVVLVEFIICTARLHFFNLSS